MKLSLQSLKNKVQEGKRETKWRKEAKTKNYWKTRCSRNTFTILAISWAYELGFSWFKRPRKAKRKIYNFSVYNFCPTDRYEPVTDRLHQNVLSNRIGYNPTDRLDPYVSSNRIGWMKYRMVGQLVKLLEKLILPHSRLFLLAFKVLLFTLEAKLLHLRS